MGKARFLIAGLVLTAALLAACSGGSGGASAPAPLIPPGPFVPPTASPTPNSASGIVTYGQSAELQPMPNIGGYGGAIAFAIPSPNASGSSSQVAIGVTIGVVGPANAPDLNLEIGGKHARQRKRPARPLVYVSLLPTENITLSAYPRIALDVPRDIVTIYRTEELGLAFYDSADTTKTYRLAIAKLEAIASPQPSSSPSSGPPTASPSPTPSPSATPGGRATPTPSPSPTVSPTAPPQRIIFAAAPGPLKLTANKAVVFALYALPVATASPSPSHAPSTAPSTAPSGTETASPDASPEPSVSPSVRDNDLKER